MEMKVEKHVFPGSSQDYYRSYLIEDSEELHHGMKRPAVIVCPGGGYVFLSDREDEPVALTFLSMGCQAFSLHYSIGDPAEGGKNKVLPEALKELAKLVAEIKKNADEWMIDRDRIFIIGFSAGAHLCASYSGLWHTDWLSGAAGAKAKELEIAACVLLYPVIDCEVIYEIMEKHGQSWDEERKVVDEMAIAMSGEKHPSKKGVYYPEYDGRAIYYPATYVSEKNPPTFIAHAADDYFIYVENTISFISALSASRVSYETHIFEKGGHGFSLANPVTSNIPAERNKRTAGWVSLLRGWLTSRGILDR